MEKRRVTFRIRRFNPADGRVRYQNYEVDVVKGMTVLEVLQYIKDNIDPTLTFRAFCRSAICGSCAVKINGYPKLACKTQVVNELDVYGTDTLTLEPLDNMDVIKDLVVDWDPPLLRMNDMKPYLVPDPEVVPKTAEEESRVSPEDHKKYDRFTDCILCTTCFSTCTAVKLDKGYGGPFQLARIYRFAVDPRDAVKEERAKIGFAYDMWKCVRCQKCADACPKHVAPVDGVMKLRGMSIDVGLRNNPGARHVFAFYKSLLESGMLNEVLLPLRTKGLKGVLENLSVGLRLLLKGKAHSPIIKPIAEHDTLRRVMKAAMEVK